MTTGNKIFNTINTQNLRGDLFGGVTAAVIALPMALAFGVASGAGAEAGLYGAILVGMFAALFGGSPTLISEPTGPMTVVMTAVIANLVASNPEHGMAMAFTVVVMAGLFQILFGMLKLGQYVTVMPYPVISGFMTGIGIILVILQLAPFLGHPGAPGGVTGALHALPELTSNIKPNEFILAACTVAILFFTPKNITRKLPPQLLALLVGTLASLTLLNSEDLRRIGEIPSGLPSFQMPMFFAEQWRLMLIDAAVLGMLGCIDALLTSVIADNLTKQQHNSDKEIIGQGTGNIMSGLFGGLPGAGATMGTVVNIQAGGRTALSGIARAVILLIVIMWFTELTAFVPLAVLAGITIKVGLNIIDWHFLKRAHKISFKGAFIMYSVILLTVFVDLITAVGIGLFVANVITISRLSCLQEDSLHVIMSSVDKSVKLSEEEENLLDLANGRIRLFYIEGPMIFGSAKSIRRNINQIVDCDAIIFDLTNVNHLGVSSGLAIEASVKENLEVGRAVFILGAKGQIEARLKNLGVFKMIPEDHIHINRPKALRMAVKRLKY